MKKEYIGYLDYCRAVAAVLIVMRHSGIVPLEYVLVFALPMFFALSGFVYTPGKRTGKEFIRARFKRLVLPFWGLTAMYAVVEAARSMALGYGTFKNLLTFPIYMLYGSSILPTATGLTETVSAYAYPYAMAYGRTYIASPSANHLWFLPALFTGSILFYLLEKKTRKGLLPKIIALAVLFAIAFLDSGCKPLTQLPWGIGSGSFGAACMLCGRWARQYRLTEKSRTFRIVTALIGTAFAVLADCLGATGGALISSYYGSWGIVSILLTFAGGIGAAWAVLCLMKGLDTLPFEPLKKILSLVGKASMEIYEYQMLFLFVLAYAFLRISGIAPQLDGWLLGFVPVSAGTTVFMVAESLAIAAFITWIKTRRSKKRL